MTHQLSSANVFRHLIDNGSLSSRGQLKRVFRQLAKDLHPDVAGDGDHAPFVQLVEQYHQALECLPAIEESTVSSIETATHKQNATLVFLDSLSWLLILGIWARKRGGRRKQRFSQVVTVARDALEDLEPSVVPAFDNFMSLNYAHPVWQTVRSILTYYAAGGPEHTLRIAKSHFAEYVPSTGDDTLTAFVELLFYLVKR